MKSASDGQLLIIAFLRDLKKKDIKVYAFVVAFICTQLALTFIKLKITPFYLYGMFSETAPSSNTFHSKHILINNKPLSAWSTPSREKLMLDVTSDYYLSIRQNQDVDVLKSRIERNYPWFSHSFIYPAFSKNIYNTEQDLDEYAVWFKEKCFEIAGKNISSIRIVDSTYVLNPVTLKFSLTNYADLATF